MRAVVTDPASPGRLVLGDVPPPEPAYGEALIRVAAFSLNAGEVRAAREATGRYVPGWDFAGVVEKAGERTPPEGTRVYGAVMQGAWAEYIAAGPKMMAVVPDGVTMAQAAALPVAGMTALLALEQAGPLLGRRVLVTGASGGVGRYACRLAHLAGAEVTAISRRPSLRGLLDGDGVLDATIFPTMAEAKEAGAYDLILDGVGGGSLATALTALAPGGLCVTYGNGSRERTSFHPGDFYHTAGARLQGLWLGNLMLQGTDCEPVLRRLAGFVRRGLLEPPIDAVLPWTEVAGAAERLAAQGVDGKVVLEIG